jgi:hypothetical protein
MGKEIRAQIDALQHGSTASATSPCSGNITNDEKGKYVKFLSNRSSNQSIETGSHQGRTASRQSHLSSLTHCLNQPCSLVDKLENNLGTTSSFGPSPCCPCGCDFNQLQMLRDRVLKQQDNIEELVVALNTAQEELSKLRGASSSETTDDAELLQKGAEIDSATHQKILAELRRQCQERVELAKMEARNANERAELEVQAMQRRTDEIIVTLFQTLQEEKEDIIKETEEIQKRVARDYVYLRGQLDDKIKCVEKNERRAVQRACTRLKRLHALENLTSKRESILSQIEDLSTDDNNNPSMKLRDFQISDESRSKDDELHCLQSQVNDMKVWLKSLTTAIQDSNNFSQSKCDALPSKVEAVPAVKIKCKHECCKPLDEPRYVPNMLMPLLFFTSLAIVFICHLCYMTFLAIDTKARSLLDQWAPLVYYFHVVQRLLNLRKLISDRKCAPEVLYYYKKKKYNCFLCEIVVCDIL